VKRGKPVVLVVLACLVAGCTTDTSGNSNPSRSSTTTRPTAEQSQLTAPQVDCNQFSNGTAQTLEHLVYASKGAQITGVTPFQFWYWVKLTPSPGLHTVVIKQSIQGTAKPLLIRTVNGVFSLTAGACSGISNTIVQNPHTGAVSITFNQNSNAASPVYIEANFGSASLVGDPVPSAQTKVVFRFSVQNVSSAVDLISD